MPASPPPLMPALPLPDVTGDVADLDGRPCHVIRNYDRMDPFLMSIVSDGDLWMFLSSRGGLTCGRGNAERALFRYQTDDLLHDAHKMIGPYTRLHIVQTTSGKNSRDSQGNFRGGFRGWEPLTGTDPAARGERSLFKSVLGNRVCFMERRADLGLTFRYTWCNAQGLGWVREAELSLDAAAEPLEIEWLDGLRGVLPAGALRGMISNTQCLVNAYRRSEVDTATGLAVYPLQSLIMDQAEPGEALTANVVWCEGVSSPSVVLSEAGRRRFEEQGEPLFHDEVKGQQAHYLLHQRAVLEPGQTRRWRMIADVALDQTQVVALRERLSDPSAKIVKNELDEAIDAGDRELRRLVASADGLQVSADRATSDHHLANVLFNIMRGGVFVGGHTLQRDDLRVFLNERNHPVAKDTAAITADWPETLSVDELLQRARDAGHPDLRRLCMEYLPLYFGRRHGDPSRPWNMFSIRVRRPDGERVLDYQGNWRDIFQNWEALGVSFPAFLEPVIAKFVNATTPDGFNPYRISRAGIDWEVPDPGNPWSAIGYWGDHQIIYLCKLLEWSRRFHPSLLNGWLDQSIFSFADVPYRLKPYAQLLADPKHTIDFDDQAHRAALARVKKIGQDGRLLHDADGRPVLATLAEKLLIPVISKLACFVTGGGIWMNTQRPEWNDANNALVGNGVSVVTLCYLRRHLGELAALLEGDQDRDIEVAESVNAWLDETTAAFAQHHGPLGADATDAKQRRALLDALGLAFERYRDKTAAGQRGATQPTSLHDLAEKLRGFVPFLDDTIRRNRRPDGLYHAYNLLSIDGDSSASVDHLDTMLEGQVAVLSAGVLGGDEVVAVVDALYESNLYRPDQHSFILYPDRQLAGFFERNVVPTAGVESNPLLKKMIETGDTQLVKKDAQGAYRFAASLINGRALSKLLDRLAQEPAWKKQVSAHRSATLDLYEQTFNHRAFTGRSGGMYGYEGLGSIYWHMVSKLWLAVQENHRAAQQRGESAATLAALADRYHRIRQGLSAAKTPEQYGAFPTDPYSHTPGHAGAQQPGMTGQVKEEILARFGELGVVIEQGQVRFDPQLLRAEEFSSAAQTWSYVDIAGETQTLELPPKSLAFTLAQVPVTYHATDDDEVEVVIEVTLRDGSTQSFKDGVIPADTAALLLARTGQVRAVRVAVPQTRLR